MTNQIMLIDIDFRRRATICHSLEGDIFHVEPFENVAELPVVLPASGTVLVHDSDNAIPALIDRMTKTGDWLPVIGFSEEADIRKVVAALHSGASDYLSWPFAQGDIAGALAASQARFGAVSDARLSEARARSKINQLTARERQVLTAVAEGLSNRRIGERLCISPRTVEIHRANMLSKIGASHTSDAIRVAIEANLPN